MIGVICGYLVIAAVVAHVAWGAYTRQDIAQVRWWAGRQIQPPALRGVAPYLVGPARILAAVTHGFLWPLTLAWWSWAWVRSGEKP